MLSTPIFGCIQADHNVEEDVDSDIQAAIYGGLYQDRSSWPGQFTCRSNCTWRDTYPVLGFAGSCENVTEATLATRTCDTSEENIGSQICSMTTPAGVQINTLLFRSVHQTVSVLNTSSLYRTSYKILELTAPTIAKYAIYNQKVDLGAGFTGTTPIGIMPESVSECSLSLSAYRHSNVSSDANMFTIGTTEYIQLEPGYSKFDGPLGDDNMNLYLNFNASGWVPELTVSARDLGALRGFSSSTLFTGATFRGESRPPQQLGCIQAFADKSAQEITDRLARSMTDALQQNPASQSNFGYHKLAVTYVRVDWRWLALLAGLEALGTALLIATILRARQKGNVQLWKSSQSALLFSHIDSDGLLVAPKMSPKDLERTVKNTATQLTSPASL